VEGCKTNRPRSISSLSSRASAEAASAYLDELEAFARSWHRRVSRRLSADSREEYVALASRSGLSRFARGVPLTPEDRQQLADLRAELGSTSLHQIDPVSLGPCELADRARRRPV